MWARNKLTVKQRFEQAFEFEGLTIEQTLETEPPSCVYDAAIVMAKFIEKNCTLEGRTAVELGAGCGFTACYVGRLAENARIIATDLDSVVPLIERNIQANQMQERVKVMPLFWGNQEHLQAVKNEAQGSVDIIYGADILFDFDHFEGLFDIFDQLHRQFQPTAEKPSPVILVGFTHRFADVERWFREGIEAKGFTMEKATEEEFAEGFKPEPFDSLTILKLSRQ